MIKMSENDKISIENDVLICYKALYCFCMTHFTEVIEY